MVHRGAARWRRGKDLQQMRFDAIPKEDHPEAIANFHKEDGFSCVSSLGLHIDEEATSWGAVEPFTYEAKKGPVKWECC